jgi:hypothetical protein
MTKYRGKKQHRQVHPKIYVWSHTEKAEIEYFQEFKQYLESDLLMPQKKLCWTPQELLAEIIEWKIENICDEDGDQVWCIFDIDDFYKKDEKGLIESVKKATKNNVKIAYINECFELWILLHFQNTTTPIKRGKNIETKIQKEFKKNKLGVFKKNQKVFNLLLPFQPVALKNAKYSVKNYEKIKWEDKMSTKGNPSTSIHFLIEEINTHC